MRSIPAERAETRARVLRMPTPSSLSRPMETLEFTIYPDGRVVEKVTGISGQSCAEVTAAIEAKLGIVLKQEKTSEFYAQTQDAEATTTASVRSYSQW